MQLDSDIASLDLDPIGYKIHLDEGWMLKEIDHALEQYRVFLQAIRNGERNLVPTREMDTVWHHHILDTQKYCEDCQKLFGKYVHHFPYSGLFGEEDAEKHRLNFEGSQRAFDRIARKSMQQQRS